MVMHYYLFFKVGPGCFVLNQGGTTFITLYIYTDMFHQAVFDISTTMLPVVIRHKSVSDADFVYIPE